MYTWLFSDINNVKNIIQDLMNYWNYMVSVVQIRIKSLHHLYSIRAHISTPSIWSTDSVKRLSERGCGEKINNIWQFSTIFDDKFNDTTGMWNFVQTTGMLISSISGNLTLMRTKRLQTTYTYTCTLNISPWFACSRKIYTHLKSADI